ncbi:MAG TPA: hypothetical protein DEQ40_10330 [Oxalobacteraceae bacterium]|jgi:hypothetical protein|nr:hypothetical protein [Oxalobacteraceae bacterium]
MGFGKFLDSKFLRENEHPKLQDLFAALPGISLVTPMKCTGKNCSNPPPGMRFAFNNRMQCAYQVVLDGVVVTQEHHPPPAWVGAFDLNAELISNLEAIEVYRSAAEVPVEYGGTRAA